MRSRARTPVTLVTGGAGFVGTNLASRLVEEGHTVRIFDNLSRPGVERNLHWLVERHGDDVEVHTGDVRDAAAVRRAVAGAEQVYHLAAQVAVTTSVEEPQTDLAVNVNGTVNVLEEVRRLDDPPPLVFTSTNKVYGTLDEVPLRRVGDRWQPVDQELDRHGIAEQRPLDFCTPYGCSKGAADQYVLDYGKSYGLATTVFRMSCIYGPHQHGTEDQGWVAHFLIRALAEEPIAIFGDGAQVRDVLFVDDLVDAFLLARDSIDEISGLAFNIGGGPDNSVSLLEVLEMIGSAAGEPPEISFFEERLGDQRYYVSDTRRFAAATGWRPQVAVEDGVEQLYRWLRDRVPARGAVPAAAG